jgi:hypothetical protein
MTTLQLLPRDMLADIEAVLQRHEGQTMQVYAESEKLRQRWEHLNIALEDIVNRLVEGSQFYRIGVVFDPGEAKGALMGSAQIDQETPRELEVQQQSQRVLQ